LLTGISRLHFGLIWFGATWFDLVRLGATGRAMNVDWQWTHRTGGCSGAPLVLFDGGPSIVKAGPHSIQKYQKFPGIM